MVVPELNATAAFLQAAAEASSSADSVSTEQQQSAFETSPLRTHGMHMVVMEMSLAFVAIVLNLVVLISIRERESLLNHTVNVVLANLCFSNLVAAVFVKSIAVIYNGYAVASGKWDVELAFCTVHTVTFRATWAVFPFSIVVICWHGLATRVLRLVLAYKHGEVAKGDSSMAIARHGLKAAHIAIAEQPLEAAAVLGSTVESDLPPGDGDDDVFEMHESESHAAPRPHPIQIRQKSDDDDDDDDFGEGLNGRQKAALGFIWAVAAAYSLMSEQVLTKERDITCPVRNPLSERLNLMSILVAIGVPTLLGPVICPLGHLVISVVGACCRTCLGGFDMANAEVAGEARTLLLDSGLVVAFSLVFALVYPTHMYVVEEYLAVDEKHFEFMAFKYCFGCLHLALLPLAILLVKSDIRQAAADVYCKRIAKKTENENEKM